MNRTRRPVVITQHGQARAVLLDISTYEDLRESVLMLRIVARGEADARAGKVVPVREAFRRIRQRLKDATRQRG